MKPSLPCFHLFYVLQLTYFPFPYHCLTSITNWDLVGLNYQHKVMSSLLSSLSILTYCYLSFNVKSILPSLNCSWYLHKYACMHACSNPDLPIAIIIGFFPEYSSGYKKNRSESLFKSVRNSPCSSPPGQATYQNVLERQEAEPKFLQPSIRREVRGYHSCFFLFFFVKAPSFEAREAHRY